MKRFFPLLILLVFSSCANFVNKIHRQIDQEERKQKAVRSMGQQGQNPYGYSPFGRKKFDKRPIRNPVTYSNVPTAQRDNPPNVKRKYRPNRKRYTADDLQDNGSTGSLWAGQDKDNFLFSDNKTKSLGDIIIVEVLEDLKNDIGNELKRAFPKPVAKKKKKKEGEKEGEEAAQGDAAADAAGATGKKDDEDETKIYDKISSQVTEIISKDYIMIRGQKEVLFRKQKRIIDLQALISKKDILNNDTVESDKILESRIFVIR
jgi:flagellar L-ring protein precursor FlgH